MEDRGKIASPIPEVILFQILRELPVKTLLRFRAVSKLWCSIIDDPDFVDSHRTHSYTRNGGISILCQYLVEKTLRFKVYSTDPEGGSPVPFLTLPLGILDYHDDRDYRNWDGDVAGLQSVNGLICRKYCVWNPSTRESFDLPPIRVNITHQFDVREAKRQKSYVFPRNLLGFDSVTKQYKVVNMCDIDSGEIRRIEYRILTLGTDSCWRNLDSVPEKMGFRTGIGVCCVDNVIFCSGWVDGTEVIVAFEVGPEKFRVIPLPHGACITSMGSYIIQVGGRLGLVNVDNAKASEIDVDHLMKVSVHKSLDYVEARDGLTNVNYVEAGDVDYDADSFQVMKIWILEDYHKQQWKKEENFTFPMTRRGRPYGHTYIFTKPMGSIHTSEVLFCSRGQVQSYGSIYSCSFYDLESKSLRMVPKVTEVPEDNGEDLEDYGEDPEDYKEDPEEYDQRRLGPRFVGFTKHVECLFRLR